MHKKYHKKDQINKWAMYVSQLQCAAIEHVTFIWPFSFTTTRALIRNALTVVNKNISFSNTTEFIKNLLLVN